MSKTVKDLEGIISKVTKKFETGVSKIGSKVNIETKKLDLKSQIGHHQRTIRQHYTRLGEAYYNSVENNEGIVDADTVINVIKANKKVIELLNAQLKDLEK